MIITKQMTDAPAVDQKDLWATPWPIFNKLNILYNFTLDPCATKETAKCKDYFTPGIDGLSKNWFGHSVFVNPPYSRGNIDQWVIKCAKSRHTARIIALLPVSTSSDWYQQHIIGHSILWVDKRIRFEGAPHTAPFSSMIVIFDNGNTNGTFKQP